MQSSDFDAIRRRWIWFGTCYFLVLTMVLTWPQTVDGLGFGPSLVSWLLQVAQGVPGLRWFRYNNLETFANILLFIPLGVELRKLVALSDLKLLVCAVLVSGFFELVQGSFLPNRYASIADVVANSVGAALGIVCTRYFRVEQFNEPLP